MKFSQQIEDYKRKIQKFANPNYPTQIPTEPRVVFTLILQNYLKEFASENFFAFRVLQQLNNENYDLLADLDQYCALNHAASAAAQKSFNALVLAYFYYYADFYPLTGIEIAIAYPALQQYVFAPLKLYKKAEQKRMLADMVLALDSTQQSVSASAVYYLRQHTIPNEVVPQFIASINTYLSHNALNFEVMYSLLFNYADDDSNHLRPLSLRFNLSSSQRNHLVISLLDHLGTDNKSARLQALFLLLPEAKWPALLAKLISQYSPSILNSIPLSHPQLANNESLANTVVQSLLITMRTGKEHAAVCACRALLTINVPQQFHVKAVGNMTVILEHSPSVLRKEIDDGLAKFISSEETKKLIKPVMIAGITQARWDVLPILRALAPHFAKDKDIINIVSNYVNNTKHFLYGVQLLDAFPLVDNILCASLNNVFSNIDFADAIDRGYFMNYVLQQLHRICKTEQHFKIVIDAFVRNLHQVNPDDDYDLLKSLSNLDYPTSLQPYVSEKITVYLNTVNIRVASNDIKEGIFELVGKLTLSETMLDNITDVALAVLRTAHVYSVVLIETACKACAGIYLRSNRQQEIVATLLQGLSNTWCVHQVVEAALLALTEMPNLQIPCAEVENLITQLNVAHLETLLNCLTHAKITALTPSFVDTVLNKFVFGSERMIDIDQVTLLFKQNLSPVAMTGLIHNLMRRLQQTPYHHIYAQLLAKLPFTRADALQIVQSILIPIAAANETTRGLFDCAMNQLSYGARCSVFAAIEGLISVEPGYKYVSVSSYLMEMKNKYLAIPMTLKKVADLPEELNEKIFSYSR